MPDDDVQTDDERPEAVTHGDLYERKGKPDPEAWDKAEAVTGRPNDLVEGEVTNSTLADRARARANAKPEAKVVDDDAAENKAVTTAAKKAPAKKAAAKG